MIDSLKNSGDRQNQLEKFFILVKTQKPKISKTSVEIENLCTMGEVFQRLRQIKQKVQKP